MEKTISIRENLQTLDAAGLQTAADGLTALAEYARALRLVAWERERGTVATSNGSDSERKAADAHLAAPAALVVGAS